MWRGATVLEAPFIGLGRRWRAGKAIGVGARPTAINGPVLSGGGNGEGKLGVGEMKGATFQGSVGGKLMMEQSSGAARHARWQHDLWPAAVIWQRSKTKPVWVAAGPNGLGTWANSRENGRGLAREIGLKLIWAADRNMNSFLN
jgi:hypothetical protein